MELVARLAAVKQAAVERVLVGPEHVNANMVHALTTVFAQRLEMASSVTVHKVSQVIGAKNSFCCCVASNMLLSCIYCLIPMKLITACHFGWLEFVNW